MPNPLRLVVTMGDPSGIGPEVIVKTFRHWKLPRHVHVTVYGDLSRLQEAAKLCRVAAKHLPPIRDFKNVKPSLRWGRCSAAAGRAAGEYMTAAIQDALAGEVDAIVTAPIHKKAFHLAGHRWQGHTDMLQEMCGIKRAVMLLVGGGLQVAVLSHHIPLVKVPGFVKKKNIVECAKILLHGLQCDFGLKQPRLAICGLNPHAGEGGDIGTEDIREILPAVKWLRRGASKQSYVIEGPCSADTVFVRHRAGEFDAVLAMYHDQGLIPLKLLGFGKAVNITLGLPFVRTSVDHGTAFDIAGTGRANPESLQQALQQAIQMVKRRRKL